MADETNHDFEHDSLGRPARDMTLCSRCGMTRAMAERLPCAPATREAPDLTVLDGGGGAETDLDLICEILGCGRDRVVDRVRGLVDKSMALMCAETIQKNVTDLRWSADTLARLARLAGWEEQGRVVAELVAILGCEPSDLSPRVQELAGVRADLQVVKAALEHAEGLIRPDDLAEILGLAADLPCHHDVVSDAGFEAEYDLATGGDLCHTECDACRVRVRALAYLEGVSMAPSHPNETMSVHVGSDDAHAAGGPKVDAMAEDESS